MVKIADWTDRISSIVFTRIKTQFSQKIKDKYSMTDKNFSTKIANESNATFPFISVRMLPSAEKGNDNEGIEINAGLFAFQVDVTDNKSQSRAKDVMSEVKRIMKSMQFISYEIPNFDNSQDVNRMTARFRRSIGKSDVI